MPGVKQTRVRGPGSPTCLISAIAQIPVRGWSTSGEEEDKTGRPFLDKYTWPSTEPAIHSSSLLDPLVGWSMEPSKAWPIAGPCFSCSLIRVREGTEYLASLSSSRREMILRIPNGGGQHPKKALLCCWSQIV